MASYRLRTLTLVSAMIAAVAAPAGAAPVVFSPANFFTDRFAANPLASLPDGNFAQLAAAVVGLSTPDSFASLNVVATQGAVTQTLGFFPFTAPIITDPLYLAFLAFPGPPTGAWSVTATDSTGTSLPALTRPLVDPELVPFVTGVTVSDASLTPTVSWTLPDLTGFDVDQLRVRVIDANTEVQLFLATFPTATTSFTVPAGVLAPGGRYIYRVSLEDIELDTATQLNVIENRSNAFSDITQVPEPATLTLMLTSLLAGIGGTRWRTRAGRSSKSA